jgi:opacity protein-like surface antigen
MMSNKKDILPEDLFDSLKNYESEFVPEDWEHMEALLDENDKKAVLIVPPVTNQTNLLQKIKNNKLILFIMITLSTVGMATWMWFASLSPSTDSVETTKSTTIESQTNQHLAEALFEKETNPNAPFNNQSEITEKEAESNNFESNKTNTASTKSVFSESSEETLEEGSTVNAGTDKAKKEVLPQPENITETEKNIEEILSGIILESGTSKETVASDTISETKTERQSFKKVVYRKEWVPPVYETTYLGFKRPIDDFWMGIHFTAQGDFGSDNFSTAGFNVQLMSGNALKNKRNLGLYGGFDFGMQFMGKSANSPVVLNTVYEDSGFTRLSTRSYDFLLRTHAEWAGGLVVPYLTAFAGPRVVSTSQKVQSYLPLTDHERSSSTNVHTSASMLLGLGSGIRWQVGKHISIDTRYEYVGATQAKTFDLDNATFNGLSYNRVMRDLNTSYGMFKFGIIINLSEERTERKKVAEGYYIETYYDSVSHDPNDTTTVYLPCPEYKECKCDKIKRGQSPGENESPSKFREEDEGRRSPNQAPSNNTPNPPKKSAPNIKSPSRTPTPRT